MAKKNPPARKASARRRKIVKKPEKKKKPAKRRKVLVTSARQSPKGKGGRKVKIKKVTRSSLRAKAKQSHARKRLPRRLQAPRNDKKRNDEKQKKPIKKPAFRPKGYPALARRRKAKKKVKKATRPSLRAKAKQSHARKRLPRRLQAPRNDKKQKKPQETDFPAQTLFKARIKVIGIGGGGSSIVSEIGRSLEKATFVVADTDARALKKKSGIKYFLFGQELTHGLGTGVNVDLAIQAAESAKQKISNIFKDQDIIIFIASLGGGLGSGATQVFAEAAREFGGITLGIFTMPFKFEGKNKLRIAQNALKELKKSLNVSLVIPNEKIFKIIDANTAITDAFSIVNKSLIESLESLIDLIYNPGVINIDFADLRTILKGIGNSAFLNNVEESGKDRAEKVCKSILVNPLLQNSNFTPEKILFNVAGSDNLSMFEVEKISRHIAEANPNSKIIFGISKNAKLKNKIKTTILMTGGGKNLAVKEKPEPVEIVTQVEEKTEPIKAEKTAVKKIKKSAIIKKKAIKKPEKKQKKKKPEQKKEEIIPIPAPLLEIPVAPVMTFNQRKMDILQLPSELSKKAIRRSGLEIKKAEEQEEKKKIEQEKEWEIPAFLRRVKYKS